MLPIWMGYQILPMRLDTKNSHPICLPHIANHQWKNRPAPRPAPFVNITPFSHTAHCRCRVTTSQLLPQQPLTNLQCLITRRAIVGALVLKIAVPVDRFEMCARLAARPRGDLGIAGVLVEVLSAVAVVVVTVECLEVGEFLVVVIVARAGEVPLGAHFFLVVSWNSARIWVWDRQYGVVNIIGSSRSFPLRRRRWFRSKEGGTGVFGE